jgi:C4-dicarboxylate transporter, DctM subunit
MTCATDPEHTLHLFGLFFGRHLNGRLNSCCVPPTIQKAGLDPIWFGIFIVLVVEMAQITPPVGFNWFVLQGMTRHNMAFLSKAAWPLFLILLAATLLLYFFEGLVLWLPSKM